MNKPIIEHRMLPPEPSLLLEALGCIVAAIFGTFAAVAIAIWLLQ